MARGPAVQIEGAKRLRKQLKQAGIDLSDLREPNLRAAQMVASAAGPRTPRRTGALAASTRPGASQTGGVVRSGGARVPYANAIHWGYPARNIRSQPWLTDAAHNTEEQWLSVYWDALDEVLSHIAGGP